MRTAVKCPKMYVQSVQNDCFHVKFVTFLSPSWRWLLEFPVVRVLVVVNIIRQPQQDDEGNEDSLQCNRYFGAER